MNIILLQRASAFLLLSSVIAGADILGPSTEQQNGQVDFNRDRLLDYDEIIFALQRKATGSGDILTHQKKKRAPKKAAAEAELAADAAPKTDEKA